MATKPMEHEFPARRSKTRGRDVVKERGKKSGRKARNCAQSQPAKEWEKLKDDATCPGKRSSFASLVSDCLNRSLREFERFALLYPRRVSLSHVRSSATTVVSIRRHDSAGCT